MEKQFRRIKNSNSSLGGVAEGLGRYFDQDPTIFRAIFVIMFFTPFPSFITYLILWAVVPEDTTEYAYAYQKSSFQNSNFTNMSNHPKNGNLVGGVILIVLGAIFAFRTFFDINLFHYIGKMWPLFLIGLGVWIILRDRDDNNFGADNYTPKKENTSDSETF